MNKMSSLITILFLFLLLSSVLVSSYDYFENSTINASILNELKSNPDLSSEDCLKYKDYPKYSRYRGSYDFNNLFFYCNYILYSNDKIDDPCSFFDYGSDVLRCRSEHFPEFITEEFCIDIGSNDCYMKLNELLIDNDTPYDACYNIRSIGSREKCYNRANKYTFNFSIDFCEFCINETLEAECYGSKAIVSRDGFYCKLINDSDLRDDCYVKASILFYRSGIPREKTYFNMTHCYLINDVYKKDRCFNFLIPPLNLDCELITDSDLKDNCYMKLKYNSGNEVVDCSVIVDVETRDSCYDIQRKCNDISDANKRRRCYDRKENEIVSVITWVLFILWVVTLVLLFFNIKHILKITLVIDILFLISLTFLALQGGHMHLHIIFAFPYVLFLILSNVLFKVESYFIVVGLPFILFTSFFIWKYYFLRKHNLSKKAIWAIIGFTLVFAILGVLSFGYLISMVAGT